MNNIKSGTKDILVGAIYRHTKTQKLYEVVNRAWHSEHDTLVPMVVYQGLYKDEKLGENPTFVQSKARFLETTSVNGKEVNRFALVYESLSAEENTK
jgi:hypothetical protein